MEGPRTWDDWYSEHTEEEAEEADINYPESDEVETPEY